MGYTVAYSSFSENGFAVKDGAWSAARSSRRSTSLTCAGIPRFGHCAITGDEAVKSFNDLAKWVSTGVKPAS
jgi:hypothetical protein